MPPETPLSNHGVYDLLHKALEMISGSSAETPLGQTTLKTAVTALAALQLALVMDEVSGSTSDGPQLGAE